MTDETAPTLPPPPNASFELASRNTGMAFQRTRMAADRTLMAVIRTSLSLLSFGFTIYKIAQTLISDKVLKFSPNATPNFGVGLVLLGVIMLVSGVIYHALFMLQLRIDRSRSIKAGLIADDSTYPPSFTLVTAIILLALGVAVILGIVFNFGPFR